MSTRTSMGLDTGEQKRVTQRAPVRTRTARPVTPVHRPSRRNRQLVIALALVIVAGFLLGLGMPIHP